MAQSTNIPIMCHTKSLYSTNEIQFDFILVHYNRIMILSIQGYRKRNEFITAQGPTKETAEDFWRMIVEQDCSIIVMLTNLTDQGKVYIKSRTIRVYR